jgi:aspartate kinase
MIVMKFGGSSVESGEALRRLVALVKSQLDKRPVVVVSAMGKTTDRLLEIAGQAERGHSYLAWKQLKELQEYHFHELEKVVEGGCAEWLEASLKRHFRNLHTMVLDVCDDGRELTPGLKDEILSFGERVSSEIVTAVLHSGGVPSIHLDARQFVVTNGRHQNATPLCWETYAKLRRVLPQLGADRVIVMGGFIGSTEAGVTTTMGRGGADLTASLVGAGISAEEIQLWKDVDGILTCDPSILPGGYRLNSLSYDEAAAMAQSGAKILHGGAVAPAVRQRIPLVIRDTRRPDSEGTKIVPAAVACSNPVKSISCKANLTVLEIRAHDAGEAETLAQNLQDWCERLGTAAEFIAQAREIVYLAVKSSARFEHLGPKLGFPVEAHVHPDSAVVTLVGQNIANAPGLMERAVSALKNSPAVAVSNPRRPLTVSLIVGQAELKKSVELLHREFFRQVDTSFFSESRPLPSTTVRAAKEGTAKQGARTRGQASPRFVLARQH